VRGAAGAGRDERDPMGWRAAAVPARPPRPGRACPGGRTADPHPGRCRLRRRRHPRLCPIRSGRRSGTGRDFGRLRTMTSPTNPAAARIRELNDTIRYTMWSVFRATAPIKGLRAEIADEVNGLFEDLAGKDVVVRGSYDVSGLRADADLMIWWHAPSADLLQDAYGVFRRTALGRHLTPVWSSTALHRPAPLRRRPGRQPAVVPQAPRGSLCRTGHSGPPRFRCLICDATRFSVAAQTRATRPRAAGPHVDTASKRPAVRRFREHGAW